MQPLYWQRGWRTVGWIRALYGWVTSANSTPTNGVDEFIASLPAIPVSPTVLPAAAKGPTTSGGLSTKSFASSTSLGLIVSSEKTSLGTPRGNSPLSYRHWRQWAIALRLEYSQRAKLEPLTLESDCSLWPTATCPAPHDSEQSVGRYRPPREGYGTDLTQAAHEWPTPRAEDSEQTGAHPGRKTADTLTSASRTWSTPRAHEAGDWTQDKGDPEKKRLSLTGEAKEWQTPATDSFRSRGGERKDEMGLDQQARLWTTPQAHDQRSGVSERVGRYGTEHGGRDLNDQAAAWMTPQATDAKRGGEDPGRKERGAGAASLAEQTAQWPTPTARDYRSPNSEESQEKRNADSSRGQQLMNFLADEMRSPTSRFSLPAPTPETGTTSSSTRHILNPLFVEWLMGWPIGWTDFEGVATGSSHWWRRMRGQLSRLVSPRPKNTLF